MTKKTTRKTVSPQKQVSSGESICFVISPIGKEGTDIHREFKEVLDYIIKPAFEESGYNHKVIRADEIDRSGSFIKDILESLYSSHIVIADLTGQNPNVFYELGVRHSLRPRTILIAQNIDDIPSDLREYRTIIYDTTAKGAAAFKKRIKTFLSEMQKEPERPDNPVLDRLGSMTENKLAQIETERNKLKEELSKHLSGKPLKPLDASQQRDGSDVVKRFDRILRLKNAASQSVIGGHFNRGNERFSLPTDQGNFKLYFLMNGELINGYWYVSKNHGTVDIDEELSDIRVLIENCSKGQDVKCNFIIVVGNEVKDKKGYYTKFEKIRKFIPDTQRKNFEFHLLDPNGLIDLEKELGLKV